MRRNRLPALFYAPIQGDGDIVVLGEQIPDKYWRDWARLPPVRPLALARPRTVGQVSAILAACHAERIPVVPQGGLTGLVGGAQPIADGIVLSLDRMSGIEETDAVAGTMTVLAGTPLHAVQTAADNAGLCFPVDLGARGSCTIGGNIATNAGGNRVIRYGMTRDHVLGLEVVLADGTVMRSLNKLVKNNAGYDLKHLLIGSEGTLGVMTRAVLRLHAKPTTVVSALCAVHSVDDLPNFLASIRAELGPLLSSFEVMWPSFYDFMTSRLRNAKTPLTAAHAAYVLLEISGFDPGRDEQRLEECLTGQLDSGKLADAIIAKSGRDIADLWYIREGVSELAALLGSVTSFDIGLPLEACGAFVDMAERQIRSRWPDAIYLAYGHLGDNNLHLVVHVPSAGADQPKADIAHMVYAGVRTSGGTVSAEHGIGLTKKAYLGHARSAEEIATMLRIKRALDPNGILNPGKILES